MDKKIRKALKHPTAKRLRKQIVSLDKRVDKLEKCGRDVKRMLKSRHMN